MSINDNQLCPRCRAAMLDKATVSADTAEQTVKRMKRFLTSGGKLQVKGRGNGSDVKIDLVLPIDKAAVIAQAIKMTGIRHHGEALVAICNAYLSE